MKPVHLIALLFVSSMFFACQKELQFSDAENPDPGTPPPTGGDIKGTWKFLYMDTDLLITGEQEQAGVKVKMTYSYNTATTKNAGTIKFDQNNCEGNAFAYTVNTNSVLETRLNGGVPNTVTTPIDVSVPPSNFSSVYKLIGTDSLYFEEGFAISLPADLGSPLPDISNPPDGAKFQIRSDTLIMTSRSSLQQTINEAGVSLIVTHSAGSTLYFKKQ